MNCARRRREAKNARHRAKAMFRARGCTCSCELEVDPIDGRPVWTRNPNTDRAMYITKHQPDCPMRLHPPKDSPEWVIVIPPEPACTR
jgi:hypothetical protein